MSSEYWGNYGPIPHSGKTLSICILSSEGDALAGVMVFIHSKERERERLCVCVCVCLCVLSVCLVCVCLVCVLSVCVLSVYLVCLVCLVCVCGVCGRGGGAAVLSCFALGAAFPTRYKLHACITKRARDFFSGIEEDYLDGTFC